jgi:hypothetical protein
MKGYGGPWHGTGRIATDNWMGLGTSRKSARARGAIEELKREGREVDHQAVGEIYIPPLERPREREMRRALAAS